VDWTLALGLTALAELQLAFFTDLRAQTPAQTAAGYGLTLLQTLPVAFRRRTPFLILLLTGSAALAQLLVPAKSADFGTFGVLVAFYTVAAVSDRRLATTVAVLAGVGIFAAKLLDPSMRLLHLDDLVVLYAQFAAAWVLGDNSRYRRRHIADLEREREYLAREAVAEERARIARELHDVVTHSLAVIMLQAGAARTVMASAPDSARACLLSIESVGRQAWSEMRHLVDLVRQDGAAVAEERPQPSLRDLPALVRRFEEAGLAIDLEVAGPARVLSAGVDLSAYRIVQEALTNTLKHAGQVRARISITFSDEAVELVVADAGGPSALPTDPERMGHGLLGMRERAKLFGGELAVDAGPDGFVVRARLPVALEPLPA
jgi:signal transduction histidine kinase